MKGKGKTVIKLAVIGALLGMVICTAITLITSFFSESGKLLFCAPELIKIIGGYPLAVAFELAVSALYGALVVGASVVYDIDEWSVLKSTVIHCAITLCSYYLTGFVLRWFSIADVKENLIMLTVFAVIYFLIWLINYIKYKSQIKQFNEDLKNLKDDEEK